MDKLTMLIGAVNFWTAQLAKAHAEGGETALANWRGPEREVIEYAGEHLKESAEALARHLSDTHYRLEAEEERKIERAQSEKTASA